MSLPYDAPIDPNSIGYRIREERLKLDMTEKEFAEAAGLGGTDTKSSNWQRVRALETSSTSKRKPLTWDELASMAIIKVDVQYVLIGRRSTKESVLSPDEAALLDNYRKTSPERRASLEEVGRAFASSSERNHKTASD